MTTIHSWGFSCSLFHNFWNTEEHWWSSLREPKSTLRCTQSQLQHQGAPGMINVTVQSYWVVYLSLPNHFTLCWCNFKVQIMISSDIMISATVCRLPPAMQHVSFAVHQTLSAKQCPPYAISQFLTHATWYVSQTSTQECKWKHIGKCDGRCLLHVSVHGSIEPRKLGVCQEVQLGVHLKQCLEVCVRTPSELTSKCTVKHDGYVLSSAFGSVFESTHQSALENVLQRVLGAHLACTSNHLGRLLGRV